MGGLKPIGSEKLEGMDKLRRIMQIARYNETTPQAVNETAKSEYKVELADGNSYEIIRERQGYIIKQTINESNDYIEPIQNRKYFSSYSQALKKMNLMAKEFNALYENEEGTSLLGEQKKKYILKQNKKKKDVEPAAAPVADIPPPPPPPAPAPAEPAPAPEPALSEPADLPIADDSAMSDTGSPDVSSEMGGFMGDEMGGSIDDEMGSKPEGDEETDIDVDVEDKTGPSDYKRIQILVGKLAQKIRSYEEDETLSNKDVKYIINSILSAIDVEVLDEDDIEQIISKLEGEDEDEDENGNSKMGDEEDLDLESSASGEETVSPESEMGEEYDNFGEAFNDYLGSTYAKLMSDDLFEDDEYGIDNTDEIFQEYERKREEKRNESPKTVANRDIYSDLKKDGEERREFKRSMIPYETKFKDFDFDFDNDFEDDEVEDHSENMSLRRKLREKPTNSHYHLSHGTFGESKIDKVISKYFTLTENEIKQTYSSKVVNKNQLNGVIQYLKENPNAIYMGKSTKGNMIFKNGLGENKITNTGNIL